MVSSPSTSAADDSLFVLMDGEALGEILGSEARDYLADPLASVRGAFDSSQDLRDPVSYWPYGERLLSISPPWGTLFWLGALGYYPRPRLAGLREGEDLLHEHGILAPGGSTVVE